MYLPATDYRCTELFIPKPLPKGLDAVVNRWLGALYRRPHLLLTLLNDATQVEVFSSKYSSLSDARLKESLSDFQIQFRRQKIGFEICLHEALAAIREAAERSTGLRPFRVQLVGAIALYRGYLAEMATGEGKTLTASLAAILSGWSRRPCHIITVNDYLAKRDAEWFQYLYKFCGLSVGFITGRMNSMQRIESYNKDVTYTTSKEIVADFLRDRLRMGSVTSSTRRQIRSLINPRLESQEGLVMRGLHTAIIDEADSVLIDEAVTPVLISRPHVNPVLVEACLKARDIARELEYKEDYHINKRYREVELHKQAHEKIEVLCHRLPGLWKSEDRRKELIHQALTAKDLYVVGKQYVIQDGKIIIVDESTGRMMPQRTWREGLHQAIEAKENLELSNPGETLARISFQQFFRYYKKCSGMTGTAQEASSEFWQIYKLPVVSIPTHKKCMRKEFPDRIFINQECKWNAVVKEALLLHLEGRPVLIGTQSVFDSEVLRKRLAKTELAFHVLNATHHQEEAQIIAGAGQEGTITIATNMAGRGTDIKLGRGVAARGGLHVISTNHHESPRIDRQLYGRAARQGDPGSAQTFVSIDDELLQRFVPKIMRSRMQNAFEKKTTSCEHQATALFNYAQKTALQHAYKQRLAVLKMDHWMQDALSFTGA